MIYMRRRLNAQGIIINNLRFLEQSGLNSFVQERKEVGGEEEKA